VGANYGDSAIWWAKKFGAKVVAFEPLNDVFIELEKNVELNSVDVVAYNVAIGNGEEIAGKSKGGMFSARGDLKIKTKRLDDYSFDRVDLLKIDVEGFEYEVLKGAENTINKFKPRIIIETHSIALRRTCDQYLLNHGYSLRQEGRTVTVKAPGMDRVTNLFYAI
jgi:FkbM family methyltransferase